MALDSELSGDLPFYPRLKEKHKEDILRTLKEEDIPYADGLTEEEKIQARELYVDTLAAERAVGSSIDIVMQPDGAKTVQTAAEHGISLDAQDISRIDAWRSFYKEQALRSASDNYKEKEVGESQHETAEKERVIKYYEERYPTLKGRDFFQTGFSAKTKDEEGLQQEARQSGTDPKTGVRIEEKPSSRTVYYANNKKAYECGLNEEGFRNGAERYYDENGRITVERNYKDGLPDGAQKRYAINAETGQLYLEAVEVYDNGNKKSSVYYNESGKQIAEEAYEMRNGTEKVVSSTTYDENNQITYRYFEEERDNQRQTVTQRDGYEYRDVYGEDGNPISWVKSDIQTGKMLETCQVDPSNKKLTYYTEFNEGASPDDENAVPSAKGYRLDGVKIGEWQEKDEQTGEIKSVYYEWTAQDNAQNASEAESANTGETSAQSEEEAVIQPPSSTRKDAEFSPRNQLLQKGYQPVEGKAGYYAKVNPQTNAKEAFYLDERTGTVSCKGNLNAQNQPTGKWEFYPMDAPFAFDSQENKLTETIEYDENGVLIGSETYDKTGKTIDNKIEQQADGSFVKTTYFGDGKTVQSTEKYTYNHETQEKKDISSEIRYHTGEVQEITTENSIEKRYLSGGLEAVYNKYTTAAGEEVGASVYYYETEKGQPAKIKSTITPLPDGRYVSTDYREDAVKAQGTVACRSVCDKDSNGTIEYFDPQGNRTIHGSLKEGKREGEWVDDRTGEVTHYRGGEIVDPTQEQAQTAEAQQPTTPSATQENPRAEVSQPTTPQTPEQAQTAAVQQSTTPNATQENPTAEVSQPTTPQTPSAGLKARFSQIGMAYSEPVTPPVRQTQSEYF